MAEFEEDVLVPGVAGLDIHHSVDQAPKDTLVRMLNLARMEIGALSARPGLVPLATAGGLIHSVQRLNQGSSGGFTRVWGVDTDLAVGQSGGLSIVDGGYSGRPLNFLSYRPELSGDAWTYIGDDNRMRKVRADGLNLPLGLSAPPNSCGSGLGAEHTSILENFENPLQWVPNPGTGGLATTQSEPGMDGNCVTFSVTPNGLDNTAPFYSYWIKPDIHLNLNQVGGVAASDDDIIHLWVRFAFPTMISEIKFYFIVSQHTSTTTLPGTPPLDSDDLLANGDAYFKAIRPSDFTQFTLPNSDLTIKPAVPASQQIVSNKLSQDQLNKTPDARTGAVAIRQSQREPARARTVDVVTSRRTWTELGVVGVPLRRGDFLRIGTDETRDWGHVTALCVVAEIASTTIPTIPPAPPGTPFVACSLDQLYITGGSGPDTVEPGDLQYDYRTINVDILTGDKSNPSPVQAAGNFLDSVRREIVVSPAAYADPAYPNPAARIRQKVYRRGGTLAEDWFFCGQNTSNGGAFTDTLTDAAIELAGTLELDNDQPVTTVDANGNLVFAQPLPSIWGPIQDMLIGCGDPLRPGHIYWCKPGEPGSWAPQNNREVCSPSEPLLGGWVEAGRAFAWSTARLFDLLPNLTGNPTGTGDIQAIPTECTRGPAGRRAFVVAKGQCYFIANDGVFRTAGSVEEDISSERLFPIFHQQAKNGYNPIDTSDGDAMRMGVFEDEVWAIWRDTLGALQCFIYSIPYGYWRYYQFDPPAVMAVADFGSSDPELVIGSGSGEAFTHGGSDDAGVPILWLMRTPAGDQGAPREMKLYGDAIVDVDRANQPITVNFFLDNETRLSTNSPLTLNQIPLSPDAYTGGGRQRFTLDPFGRTADGDSPNRARNASIQLQGLSSAAGQTLIYQVGTSWILQPDTTIYRPTDWDFGGRLTDKWIKGILLEVDTFGRVKLLNIEADGRVIQQVQVQTNTRTVVEFAFPEQLGRVIRLHPAVETQGIPWVLYKHDWIFDEEPLQLNRWETQEINHGITGWQSPLFAWLTMRSPSQVTLTVTCYREAGSPVPQWNPFPYILPATGPTKRTLYLPFDAMKGMLFKWVFESSGALHLHREESSVIIQPWAAGSAQEKRPFGSDDLDLVRSMQSARLTAARNGGG